MKAARVQGYRRSTGGRVAFFVRPPRDAAAARRYRQRPDWLRHCASGRR